MTSNAPPGATTFDDVLTTLGDGQTSTFTLPLRPFVVDPNNPSKTAIMGFTITP